MFRSIGPIGAAGTRPTSAHEWAERVARLVKGTSRYRIDVGSHVAN